MQVFKQLIQVIKNTSNLIWQCATRRVKKIHGTGGPAQPTLHQAEGRKSDPPLWPVEKFEPPYGDFQM